MDDGLQILLLAVAGQEKRRGFAIKNRPAYGSFEDAPLLGSTHQRKRVTRVQGGIAEDEIEGPMVFGGTFFGNDLNGPPAGTRNFSRIGILIDAHLLNGRSRNRNC